MPIHYSLSGRDDSYCRAATLLLEKLRRNPRIQPTELVSISKLLYVFSRLPLFTPKLTVGVSVSLPEEQHDQVKVRRFWTIRVEQEQLSIDACGTFWRPETGGDSFTSMTWSTCLEGFSEFSDYRDTLRMIPGLESFLITVENVPFESAELSIEIEDDNPLLSEDDTDWNEEEVFLEEEADEEIEAEEWSLNPRSRSEVRLFQEVNPKQVNTKEPQYGTAEKCGICDCGLNSFGAYVDGRLQDSLKWGYLCPDCFAERGAGLGTGDGQLYARQADGRWRLVAGFV